MIGRFRPFIDRLVRRCPYLWRSDCLQELLLCACECYASHARLSDANVRTYLSRRYRKFLDGEYEWRATKGTEAVHPSEFDLHYDISAIDHLAALARQSGYELFRVGDTIILRSSL